jgi:hypothetical protein
VVRTKSARPNEHLIGDADANPRRGESNPNVERGSERLGNPCGTSNADASSGNTTA